MLTEYCEIVQLLLVHNYGIHSSLNASPSLSLMKRKTEDGLVFPDQSTLLFLCFSQQKGIVCCATVLIHRPCRSEQVDVLDRKLDNWVIDLYSAEFYSQQQ